MSFNKKTIKDIDVNGKSILVRASLNVPIKNGEVTDKLRLKALIPTLDYLLERNAKLILISHHSKEGVSLAPVAPVLSSLLNRPVKFIGDSMGRNVQDAAKSLQAGEIVMLENLRFHSEEEANDPEFAKSLAGLAEIYVDDDFTTMHRVHASVVGVPKYLPAVAGLQVEQEVRSILEVMDSPRQPLIAIIGGAKIGTKIELLNALIDKARVVIIGGIMANTFLADKHFGQHKIGKSVFENEPEAVGKIVKHSQSREVKLLVPDGDMAVGKSRDDIHRTEKPLNELSDDDIILDIAGSSIDQVVEQIRESATVIWNGPFGYTENPQFQAGSLAIARAIIDSGATSIVGGGDTAGFIDSVGLHDKFSFVSTGGGASLELMSGKKLPGLEALLDK